ncbi:MAG: RNA-guided pseudouridylation complex pseudouridine synthase subunit Cbf5 [Thermoplasmatales archaeon]|nr:RNA-guided pseudouridylation complex pseudouridine synthase subunit Cbf5 [Thermoplasmatales archaeon]MCW6170546.1 RNA-guided pseudouridylation complex pseudouridine synthase subunit Cbf5 [Thermoplasmatales archaeon]
MQESEKEKNELNGFIVIDKPKGPTSHQVDYWVRQILGVNDVGHIGTLDPEVTGVLVMAIGKATKLIDVAHEQPKEYVSVMRLYTDVPHDLLDKVFEQYHGPIYQLPPVKSAVARNLRVRTIYDLDIMETNGRLVLFRVKCESGTYIRTLCQDLGLTLGCGAQMADLRRTSTGVFKEEDAVTLQYLKDSLTLKNSGNTKFFDKIFLPLDYLFKDYPKVIVKKSSIWNIAHGSDLYPGGIKAILGKPLKGDRVAVMSENNELLGTGHMLVSYDAIRDLKVVDFDRIIVENPQNPPGNKSSKKMKIEKRRR